MTGELPSRDGRFDNESLHEALDLCLQCKACKTECPSKVDMAKLKAEVLHQRYQNRPRPIGHLLLGQIFRLNPIASATAPLANAMLRQPGVQVAAREGRRDRPPPHPSHVRAKPFPQVVSRGHRADDRAGTRGTVILLDDCFTTYNDPEVGIAAVRVLEAAGYRVELAGLACCGRPAISKGLLPLARELAAANVKQLLPATKAGIPILGCEPSCLVTLIDEYRDFRLGPDAEDVAASAQLVDAFVADPERVPDLPLEPGSGRVLLHGHCQQKAVLGTAGSLAALLACPGPRCSRAGFRLLRHGRLVRLRARPL